MTELDSTDLGADAELVRAIVEALDDDQKTAVLVLSACSNLPTLDLSGRLRALGLILENGTISNLGRAIAKELLRDDPEAEESSGEPSNSLKAAPRKADEPS